MRAKLTIEYDGTCYRGWQLQKSDDTIQARLEAAAERLFQRPVRMYGAGRTDAGVHALGQVAAFDLPRPIAPDELQRALNALLPVDIVVRQLELVPDQFDPRRDARMRIYEYHLLNRRWPSPFEYRTAWLVRQPVDLQALNHSAQLFIGRRDFAAFRTLGSEERTTLRDIYASSWRVCAPDRLVYRVVGSSFMRHMVRAMVATMVEVGLGRLDPRAVAALLDGAGRAPAAAPACGLFLVEVVY